ncbi:protein ROS1A-like [Cornus florida]|uniref:protein ROS1A-like n=1 Tax=Cornus florida TaxID=4283 RepID=UPI0028A07C7E|nr:protein ROS1A-like [Cornus florida]
MELGNPMEGELEKQGVWIPVTPEKFSLTPVKPPEQEPEPISVDSEWKKHMGQSFSAGNWDQPVVLNAVTSMDTNRGMYNCDTTALAAAKQGTVVDHNVAHTSNGLSGDLEETTNCGLMGCGNSSLGVPKLGNWDNLTFMEILALANNTQPISASAFDAMPGSSNKINDKPDQQKDNDEIQCEGKNSHSTPIHRKRPRNVSDSNKKPRHRPKKKKYWPKIADEGKARKASKSRKPMSSTPAPKTPKHATSKKRKNARKKNVKVSANLGEADPKPDGHDEHAAKSCKRVLTFILEAHARENNDLSNKGRREVATEQNLTIQGCGYNSLQVYRRLFQANNCQRNSKLIGPNFPRIFKKRRMTREKSIHWGSLYRRLFVKMMLPTELQRRLAFGDPKSFNCIFSLIPAVKFKQRRSSGLANPVGRGGGIDNNEHQHVESKNILTEVHNNNLEIDNNENQPVGSKNILMEGQDKMVTGAQIEDVTVTSKRSQVQGLELATPKVTPKSSVMLHSTVQRLQLAAPKVTPKSSQVMLDYIIRQLECVCISDEGGCQLVVYDQNSHFSESEHRALVPYDLKKRKKLPKVDLDSETMRVWKMLTEGLEEEDKNKEKWWEKKREVFRGRVDSFISKMHLIQGSVVDSVVGVFLTQNVSDHLSSSAFMSLAAQFPLQSTNNHIACNLQGAAEEAWDANDKQSLTHETAHDTSDQLLNRREETIGTRRPISHEGEVKREVKDASALQNLDSLTGGDLPATFILCTDETSPRKIDRLSCDATEINGNGMETQRQGSSSSDKVFDLEGAYASGHFPENHCSKVPLVPSDMEIDSQGLLGGFENIKMNDTGIMSNNLRKVDTYSSLHKCQLPHESHLEPTKVGKEKILHASNNHKEKNKIKLGTLRTKKSKVEGKQEKPINWDDLRKTYSSGARKTSGDAMDSLDWEAVRQAPVEVVSKTIVERGMNNVLATRIKGFLERVVRDHGSLNLEWLRKVPPDKSKEYLLSIEGLGLKSVECLRLLTLHHHAFPVDTNVARVAVRLGWVPLQPLPDSIQIHLLDQYPMMDSIQKYLWPRLCTLDQPTLYELHYQMITFGKVFCTKRRPNCNACPMRGECRHFASAFASSRLALPGLQQTSSTNPGVPVAAYAQNPVVCTPITGSEENLPDSRYQSKDCEPIIEMPASPGPEYTETLERDIEDLFTESDDEIPTIKLNIEELKGNLLDYIHKNNIPIPEEDMSKALVVLSSEAASMPVPKMKYVSRLKTMHYVYEIPDGHPLLEGLDKREPNDPNPYLLAVWTSGKNANSSKSPKKQCDSMGSELCNINTWSSCNNIPEQDTVPGTILIPCRTATRGSFPLNGTYFQINEVFADDESSQKPIDVPREWIRKLDMRPLGCGTSVSTILGGFSTDRIQKCFRRGFICVRGFNRKTRFPEHLANRFHTSTTDIAKAKMTDE